jgi:hypothetical protein
MNGDGVVEIALGRAHADGDGKALQHLVHAFADQVATDDFFFRPDADQFHQRIGWAGGEGVVHRPESGLINPHRVAVLLLAPAPRSSRWCRWADG